MHLRDLGLQRDGARPFRLSVRAVDGAGNIGPAAAGERPALRASRPSRCRAGLPRSPALLASAPLPRLGTGEVAVIDELDKIHPATGEFIPSQPDGYLQANHLWNADEPDASRCTRRGTSSWPSRS